MLFKLVSVNDINAFYWKRYKKFIIAIKLKNRQELNYSEKHHIIPRSINIELDKEESNIIKLSAREHYLAHYILTKCFINSKYKRKMYFAFNLFVYGKNNCNHKKEYKISSRAYHYIKMNKDLRKHTEEEKQKISKANKGNKSKLGLKDSKETKLLKSKAGKNRIYTKQTGMKVSQSLKLYFSTHSAHNKNKSCSKQQKLQISKTLKQRYIDDPTLKQRITKNHYNCFGQNNPCYGKKQINNGIIEKYVPPEQLQEFLNFGWKMGHIKRKYINKNGKNTTVKLCDVDKYLSLGWQLGRI